VLRAAALPLAPCERMTMVRVSCLALCLAAAALPAAADDMLLGTWDITITDGSAVGDHGTLNIEKRNGVYEGDMVFVDADAGVTATERCNVWPDLPAVKVYCVVLTPQRPTYLPDNLTLQVANPNRLEGQLVSATTGTAILTRQSVPSS
jgi:hypothetical protein